MAAVPRHPALRVNRRLSAPPRVACDTLIPAGSLSDRHTLVLSAFSPSRYLDRLTAAI